MPTLKYTTKAQVLVRLSESDAPAEKKSALALQLIAEYDDASGNAIMSSTYTLDDHAQPDGSIWVFESHTDSEGVVHRQNYLAPPNDTTQAREARMAARAEYIAERLAAAEAEEIING